MKISIHSPRMGRDGCPCRSRRRRKTFQSTLPAWGETFNSNKASWEYGFQSTLPAWGETGARWKRRKAAIFQSTLPAWGETRPAAPEDHKGHISIHSPRMGRDEFVRITTVSHELFQSTLPAWGETLPRPDR